MPLYVIIGLDGPEGAARRPTVRPRRFTLPATIMVLTSTTFTLNIFSTASRTSFLLARVSTANRTALFVPLRSVAFSVMSGRRMMAWGFSMTNS
mgnify:CR=1 FL=1